MDVFADLTNIFTVLSAVRVKWKNCEALAVRLQFLPQDLAWGKDGLKYLCVFLGNKIIVQSNLQKVKLKVEGKFKKLKWLLPYTVGSVLVLNNLVASCRLICVNHPIKFVSPNPSQNG